MHIAIDLDDTILEFMTSILASIEREYGVHIPYESLSRWNDHPLSHLEVFGKGRNWLHWLEDHAWLWSTWPAIKGAIGGIEQLHRDGHYLELVTVKDDWARSVVWSWLARWKPKFDSVTIVKDHEGSKSDHTEAELLIDDAPHFIERWQAAGRQVIVFDQPWNRHQRDCLWVKGDDSSCVCELLNKKYGPPRANNWGEVIRLIQQMSAVEV